MYSSIKCLIDTSLEDQNSIPLVIYVEVIVKIVLKNLSNCNETHFKSAPFFNT